MGETPAPLSRSAGLVGQTFGARCSIQRREPSGFRRVLPPTQATPVPALQAAPTALVLERASNSPTRGALSAPNLKTRQTDPPQAPERIQKCPRTARQRRTTKEYGSTHVSGPPPRGSRQDSARAEMRKRAVEYGTRRTLRSRAQTTARDDPGPLLKGAGRTPSFDGCRARETTGLPKTRGKPPHALDDLTAPSAPEAQ